MRGARTGRGGSLTLTHSPTHPPTQGLLIFPREDMAEHFRESMRAAGLLPRDCDCVACEVQAGDVRYSLPSPPSLLPRLTHSLTHSLARSLPQIFSLALASDSVGVVFADVGLSGLPPPLLLRQLLRARGSSPEEAYGDM